MNINFNYKNLQVGEKEKEPISKKFRHALPFKVRFLSSPPPAHLTRANACSKCIKCMFAFEILMEHLTRKIDGFYELVTLIERLEKSGGVSFDKHANF